MSNFHWIWNILVVVFLNCYCEINFRAPSRYKKGCVIEIKIFHSDLFFFFETAKNKKVNKQSNFDTNFNVWQPVQMTWTAHLLWNHSGSQIWPPSWREIWFMVRFSTKMTWKKSEPNWFAFQLLNFEISIGLLITNFHEISKWSRYMTATRQEQSPRPPKLIRPGQEGHYPPNFGPW